MRDAPLAKLRVPLTLAGAGMLFIPCMPATGLGTRGSDRAATCSTKAQCSLPGIVDVERARRNYLALAQGAKAPHQLSPIEAEEVRALIRLMEQNRAGNSDAYERCRDRQLGGRTDASELELRLIDLKCSMR